MKTKTKDQKWEDIKIILEEHGLQWKYDFTGALVDSLFKEIAKAEKKMGEGLKMKKKKLEDNYYNKFAKLLDNSERMDIFYDGFSLAAEEQNNKIDNYLKK